MMIVLQSPKANALVRVLKLYEIMFSNEGEFATLHLPSKRKKACSITTPG